METGYILFSLKPGMKKIFLQSVKKIIGERGTHRTGQLGRRRGD